MSIRTPDNEKNSHGVVLSIMDTETFQPVIGTVVSVTRRGELVANDYVSVEDPEDGSNPQTAPDAIGSRVFVVDNYLTRTFDIDGGVDTVTSSNIINTYGTRLILTADSFDIPIEEVGAGAPYTYIPATGILTEAVAYEEYYFVAEVINSQTGVIAGRWGFVPTVDAPVQ